MDNPKILLIDDDIDILESTAFLLSDDYEISKSTTVSKAKVIIQRASIDLAVVDLNFAGHELDGIDFIDFMLKEKPTTPIIVLSGDDNTSRVVEAMKRPLIDFVAKDGGYDEKKLRTAIEKGLNKRQEHLRTKDGRYPFLTESPKMQRVLRDLDRVLRSQSDSPILILGESGTGKEELAKYIASSLRKKLFSANISSVPKETAESELFGHIKGAFTGAIANKTGLITQADKNVFFLDEIGDCHYDVQIKLLRVIQEKEIQPVGSNKVIHIDTRFIAATHQNLQQLVDESLFRLDLLQRLNTFTFRIPPLRERPEDITFYTNLLVNKLAGDSSFSIDPSGLEMIHKHDWKGNVRELKNIIERVVVCSDRKTLDGLSVSKAFELGNLSSDKVERDISFDSKKSQVMSALKETRGNKTRAAEILGINKSTLHRWVKELELNGIVKTNKGRPKGSKSFRHPQVS